MSPDEAKRTARARAREARRSLEPEQRLAASRAIALKALGLPEVYQARTVLAYSALPEEADPAPLIEALRRRGARIALPRVCGPETMTLHWVEPDEVLVPGALGVLEPPESCARASLADFDLVVVPGVAFDAACRRLGFGGGYYDGLLPELPPGADAVAIAFDEQILGEVPCGPRDAGVDIVVTPTRVIRPR